MTDFCIKTLFSSRCCAIIAPILGRSQAGLARRLQLRTGPRPGPLGHQNRLEAAPLAPLLVLRRLACGWPLALEVGPSIGRRLGVDGAEEPLEGLAEVRRENGVDDWVEHGVEVAEPEEEGEEVFVWPQLEEGHCDGHDEEGEPAHDEDARDDGQRLGRLPLPLGLHPLEGGLLEGAQQLGGLSFGAGR